MMIYRKINISESELYFVSEDCAKAFIDWRIDTKKGITQRVFDNTLKQAQACSEYGLKAEDAFDRLMESGWSGMKWVLAEAKREFFEKRQEINRDTRDIPIAEQLTDTRWAN